MTAENRSERDLSRELARSTERADRAVEERQALAGTLAEVEARAAAERAQAARLAAQLEDLRGELERSREHTQLITSSSTWRLTEPLRRLQRSLKK